MGEIKEECGVFGIYLKNRVATNKPLIPKYLYLGLSALQHRGQLSAGLVSWDPTHGPYRKILNARKDGGKVDDLFNVKNEEVNKNLIDYLRGYAGMGHVRYCTSGSTKKYQDVINGTQPFQRRHARLCKRFALGFNGTIANVSDLRKNLRKEGYYLDTQTDTEVLMHLISKYVKNSMRETKSGKLSKPDLFEVQEELMNQLDGSYSLLELFADGNMVATRDPWGFKPFVWGETSEFFAVASESTALKKLDIENFYDVKPGSSILFNQQGVDEKILVDIGKTAYCHFEEVYFSKTISVNNGVLVNGVRKNLGRNLAKNESLRDRINSFKKDFVVVPVPKTAIPAAKAYADELGLNFEMAIEKLKGDRGFINKASVRERIMSTEYEIIADEIKGKKVIVVDDSVVRGETSKKIMHQLRNAGAKEIHFRSTEPPIKYPCFYGIDFATRKELVANKYSDNFEEKFAEFLGVESVGFQTLEGLVDAMGFDKDQLCLACLNGDYPTEAGKKLANISD